MGKFIDLTGQRFGRLLVISRAPDKITSSGQHITRFNCKCDCGNEVIIRARSLRERKTQSCGCFHKEMLRLKQTTHNGSYTPLYAVHRAMKQRCENPNDHSFKWYGARGIKVCEDWHSFKNFQRWALQSGYKQGLTIERKDVNGDYCPKNCTWITIQEQQRNRRKPNRKD